MKAPIPSSGSLRVSADALRYYASTPDDPMAPTMTPRRPSLDRSREETMLAIAVELEQVADRLERRSLWSRIRYGWDRMRGAARSSARPFTWA